MSVWRKAVCARRHLPILAFVAIVLNGGTTTPGAPLLTQEPHPMLSPHGDLVFRATGTRTCADCHGPATIPGRPSVLDNEPVRMLIAKGKGNHGPGRFADCFRCHAGGRIGEKY